MTTEQYLVSTINSYPSKDIVTIEIIDILDTNNNYTSFEWRKNNNKWLYTKTNQEYDIPKYTTEPWIIAHLMKLLQEFSIHKVDYMLEKEENNIFAFVPSEVLNLNQQEYAKYLFKQRVLSEAYVLYINNYKVHDTSKIQKLLRKYDIKYEFEWLIKNT